MSAAHLIKEARRRAGLTQRQLAERLATHQPVIARWESGASQPDFSTVVAAIRATGLELAVSISTFDDHDLSLIRRELDRAPHERLAALVRAVNAFGSMAAASNG